MFIKISIILLIFIKAYWKSSLSKLFWCSEVGLKDPVDRDMLYFKESLMVISEVTGIHVVKLKHCLHERNVPIGYDIS